MGASDSPDLLFPKRDPRRGGKTVQRERREKSGTRKAAEDKVIAAAKRRDGKCRWPGCDCGALRLRQDGAHWRQHRGMGGNPACDRTTRPDIIRFCFEKHRALDRGDIAVKPLTDKGADGPMRFFAKVEGRLVKVADEIAVGVIKAWRMGKEA